MADQNNSSSSSSSGGDDGGARQQAVASPSVIFGVDNKHLDKWLGIWQSPRLYSQVHPSADRPKKLNCAANDFHLRGRSPLCSLDY